MSTAVVVAVQTAWFTLQLLVILGLAGVAAGAAVSGILSLADDLVQRRRP